jgi:putative Mn2+ efflux pump MntP
LIRIVTLIVLILPLALDTFVLSTALGVAGISRRDRVRVSLILSGFEAGMPLVGFFVGAGLGSVIGPYADYAAALVLAGAGGWMLRPGKEDEEEERKVRLLESARGWAIAGLGLSISLDELAIGFGVGLLRLPLVLLVFLIAAQAFFAAQLGMRLGSRLADKTRESAEKIAGLLLVIGGVLIVVEKELRL